MTRLSFGSFPALVLGLVAGGALALASAAIADGDPRPAHASFDELLRRYVSDAGVRYAAWHAHPDDRQSLREYVANLETIAISRVEAESDGRDVALAYWINLYNAVTVNLILDGYPTDSIKDLGGLFSSPWKRDLVAVEGERLTLNEIENDIIRPRFREPRIHFALNCAAISCPPLRAEAYVAERLDSQLEEQTRTFIGNPEWNRREEDGLRLSKIFDWYGDDFRDAAGSVPAYVGPYLTDDRDAPGDDIRVRHFDYDWALNESPEPRP